MTEKIRPIQIHAILKAVYCGAFISVLISIRFAVGRSAPLKSVMLLVMSNLVAPPAADTPHGTTEQQHRSADQLIRKNRNIYKESLATELNVSRERAQVIIDNGLGTEKPVRIMSDTAQARRQRSSAKTEHRVRRSRSVQSRSGFIGLPSVRQTEGASEGPSIR